MILVNLFFGCKDEAQLILIKVSQDFISPHRQLIEVFSTIQINQQKTPRLLDLILNTPMQPHQAKVK